MKTIWISTSYKDIKENTKQTEHIGFHLLDISKDFDCEFLSIEVSSENKKSAGIRDNILIPIKNKKTLNKIIRVLQNIEQSMDEEK